MRNSITIILTLGILVVAPAMAHSNVTEQAAPTASQDHANNTSALWDKIATLEVQIKDKVSKAERDLKRHLVLAALHRYQNVIPDIRTVIGLLDTCYASAATLEEQTRALTLLGREREELHKTRDLVKMLRRVGSVR